MSKSGPISLYEKPHTNYCWILCHIWPIIMTYMQRIKIIELVTDIVLACSRTLTQPKPQLIVSLYSINWIHLKEEYRYRTLPTRKLIFFPSAKICGHCLALATNAILEIRFRTPFYREFSPNRFLLKLIPSFDFAPSRRTILFIFTVYRTITALLRSIGNKWIRRDPKHGNFTDGGYCQGEAHTRFGFGIC